MDWTSFPGVALRARMRKEGLAWREGGRKGGREVV